MSGPIGFFNLADATDLLVKLRHDFARVIAAPTDSYAAFDFFVTAEHLLDWQVPGNSNKANRKARRQSSALLRVTSHLASGAKHFRLDSPHHTAVTHEHAHAGAFAPGVFDPLAFDTSCLVVSLDAVEASELGAEIRVPTLARRVLDYWEAELGGRSRVE